MGISDKSSKGGGYEIQFLAIMCITLISMRYWTICLAEVGGKRIIKPLILPMCFKNLSYVLDCTPFVGKGKS